ncbi:MAG: tyrosine-type recombinase/integrase [Candidatus Acidiferrales bacterium]
MPANHHPGLIPPEKARALIQMWRQEFAATTAYQYTRALHRVNRWLAQTLRLPQGPETALPTLHTPPQRTIMPTEKEMAAMLEKSPPALRLVLLLCADAGLRSGEAMRIAPIHYNAAQGTILFRQKGDEDRAAQVTGRIRQLFDLAPDTGEPLTTYVVRLAGTKRFTFAAMERRWRKLKADLHVNPQLHIHDLRRLLATRAYEKTKDLRVAQALLGHKSLTSTVRYIAPFDAPKLRPLMEALKIPTRWKQ